MTVLSSVAVLPVNFNALSPCKPKPINTFSALISSGNSNGVSAPNLANSFSRSSALSVEPNSVPSWVLNTSISALALTIEEPTFSTPTPTAANAPAFTTPESLPNFSPVSPASSLTPRSASRARRAWSTRPFNAANAPPGSTLILPLADTPFRATLNLAASPSASRNDLAIEDTSNAFTPLEMPLIFSRRERTRPFTFAASSSGPNLIAI